MLALGGAAMQSVKVNRLEVLEIVRANKVAHIEEYEEAVDNYLVAAVEKAKKNLKIAKSEKLDQVSNITWDLPKPKSHADEYDRAIRMIELSVEPEINLPAETFNQLILDEWTWKNTFARVSNMYKVGLAD